MARSIDTILVEWRAAETRLEDEPADEELQELLSALRDEYAAAVADRSSEAADLTSYGIHV